MPDRLEAVFIPLSDIVPGPNDRTIFNEEELGDLAADILQNGLIQPITVRPWQGKYQIVAGERRYRAHQIAGLPAIPAYIKDLTDEQADTIMLSENLSRAELDPIDEGRAIQKRMDRYGWTVRQAAQHLNLSEARIKNRLSLLNMIPNSEHLVRTGQFPLGHAEALRTLDKNSQLAALRVFSTAKRQPTRSEFTALCGELEAKQNQAALFDMDQFMTKTVESAVAKIDSRMYFEFRVNIWESC